MNNLSHIIVAFDGSDGGRMALDWGVKLIKTLPKATLTIVHVYSEKVEERVVGSPNNSGYSNDGLFIDPTLNQPINLIAYDDTGKKNATHSIVKKSSVRAERLALEILEVNQVDGDFIILEGNAAESIIRYVEDVGADLIIVGNSGKSGLRKLFLGSTSSTVAKDAHCPVLIAK